MKMLKLAQICIDGGTQARQELNQSVVGTYSENMKDGDKFPPIVVFFDGSTYWLADGFHRYFANKSNGALEVECEVKHGVKDDAILYALAANARRGLLMSVEDIKANIERMLKHPEWGQWSNAEIAKHLGTYKMMVYRVRHALEEKEEIEPAEETKYKREGQERVMKKNPVQKKKEVVKETKIEEPKEPQPEPTDIVKELTETITQLSEENELLKDKIAIGQWDASEIEKIVPAAVSRLANGFKTVNYDMLGISMERCV